METSYIFPLDYILRDDLEKFLLTKEQIKKLDSLPALICEVSKREVRLYNDRLKKSLSFIIRDLNEESGEAKTLLISAEELEKKY